MGRVQRYPIFLNSTVLSFARRLGRTAQIGITAGTRPARGRLGGSVLTLSRAIADENSIRDWSVLARPTVAPTHQSSQADIVYCC